MLDFLVITLFLRHAFPLEVFENLSSNTQGKMRTYKVGLWNGTGFSMVWSWEWDPQTPGDLSQRNYWRYPRYVDVCLDGKCCYFKCVFILKWKKQMPYAKRSSFGEAHLTRGIISALSWSWWMSLFLKKYELSTQFPLGLAIFLQWTCEIWKGLGCSDCNSRMISLKIWYHISC